MADLSYSLPTPEQYNTLRSSIGWGTYDLDATASGLASTLFCVCAYDAVELIGMARVIGDGKMVFYIQDVIVLPEYQKKGIGSQMMQAVMHYIKANAVNNTIVGLMSVAGKESFYEKYGFFQRPDGRYGCGMTQFIKREGP